MDLKSATNFMTFLDERGLTAKALRVKNLQKFVEDINKLIAPLLEELNTKLITDPATIVAPSHFKELPEIVAANIAYWEKIDFPTRDLLYVRTSGWNSTFYFPNIDIPIDKGLATTLTLLNQFLEKNQPEQIILHPRYSVEVAMTKQFSIRAKATPGDTHILIGRGGTVHINRMEDTLEHFEFSCSKPPNNLPEEFQQFSRAIEILVPVADSLVSQYSNLVTENNLPVYEFKGIVHNGQFLLNLFDYEIA